jgi:hypothetical protein
MRVKVCPDCGTYNPEEAWTCSGRSCAAILSMSDLVDVEEPQGRAMGQSPPVGVVMQESADPVSDLSEGGAVLVAVVPETEDAEDAPVGAVDPTPAPPVGAAGPVVDEPELEGAGIVSASDEIDAAFDVIAHDAADEVFEASDERPAAEPLRPSESAELVQSPETFEPPGTSVVDESSDVSGAGESVEEDREDSEPELPPSVDREEARDLTVVAEASEFLAPTMAVESAEVPEEAPEVVPEEAPEVVPEVVVSSNGDSVAGSVIVPAAFIAPKVLPASEDTAAREPMVLPEPTDRPLSVDEPEPVEASPPVGVQTAPGLPLQTLGAPTVPEPLPSIARPTVGPVHAKGAVPQAQPVSAATARNPRQVSGSGRVALMLSALAAAAGIILLLAGVIGGPSDTMHLAPVLLGLGCLMLAVVFALWGIAEQMGRLWKSLQGTVGRD